MQVRVLLSLPFRTDEGHMRLQDAIVHAEDAARKCSDKECSAEHQQLAEWLKELQALRDKGLDSRKT